MDRAYSLDPNLFILRIHNVARLGRSFALAGLITLLLVLLMSRLIATDYEVPVEDPYPRIASIHMPPVEPTVQRVEPPATPQTPPPQPVATQIERRVDPVSVPTLVAPPGPGNTGMDPSITSRDPVPVFKPAPRYPSAALRRGIEGYVVVEFSISRSGSVQNPQVVAGYDGQGNITGLFDRAALAAVARFKYQPQLEDGEPVVRHGVRNRISFKMAE